MLFKFDYGKFLELSEINAPLSCAWRESPILNKKDTLSQDKKLHRSAVNNYYSLESLLWDAVENENHYSHWEIYYYFRTYPNPPKEIIDFVGSRLEELLTGKINNNQIVNPRAENGVTINTQKNPFRVLGKGSLNAYEMFSRIVDGKPVKNSKKEISRTLSRVLNVDDSTASKTIDHIKKRRKRLYRKRIKKRQK